MTGTHLLRLVLPLVLVLALVCGAAVVVDDDGVDTVLGAVAGAGSVALLLVVALALLDRRATRRADLAALDRLEPLRAARRDDA